MHSCSWSLCPHDSLLNTNKSMAYLNWKYAGKNVSRSVHKEFMHSMFEVSTNSPPLLLASSKSLLHIIAHCCHIKSKYLHRNERIFVENMINCWDFVFAPSNHNYTIISLRGKHTKKYGHGFGLLTVGSLNCHLHKKVYAARNSIPQLCLSIVCDLFDVNSNWIVDGGHRVRVIMKLKVACVLNA